MPLTNDQRNLPADSVALLRSAWLRLSAAGLTEKFLQTQSPRIQLRLHHDFACFAHPHQEHGETGNNGGPWTTWLMLGGRGAGKTRTGAEWVRALVRGTPPYADHAHGRVALIGELTVECAALWCVLMHEFWTGDIQTINALVNATALLVTYWGFRFGVLGVYISGRTREKVSALTGQDSPGMVEKLVKAVLVKDGVKKK